MNTQNTIPVYFSSLGITIYITLRYFDYLLHAFVLKYDNGWVTE